MNWYGAVHAGENEPVIRTDLERTNPERKLATEQTKADPTRWMTGLLIDQTAVVGVRMQLLYQVHFISAERESLPVLPFLFVCREV